MALLLRRCKSCGHEFEVLTTVKHSLDCPECGGEASNLVQGIADMVYTKVYDPVDAKLIHQNKMRHKARLDARSDDIRSGKIDLELRGPKEYWPEAAKEKRFY